MCCSGAKRLQHAETQIMLPTFCAMVCTTRGLGTPTQRA